MRTNDIYFLVYTYKGLKQIALVATVAIIVCFIRQQFDSSHVSVSTHQSNANLNANHHKNDPQENYDSAYSDAKQQAINEKEEHVTSTPVLEKTNINAVFLSLTQEDLAQLDPGMINVTAFREGIRLSSLNNYRNVVSLAVDSNKVPPGYTSNDVHIFLFNTETAHWIQLKRDSIDVKSNIVYSTTSKDGDYINAIIKAPDAPETQGYVPTTMDDIKVGDPAAMVQTVAFPQANSQGTSTLKYHIETPNGRRGIQPNLNVVYSSDGGNGWIGEGWSVNGLSSISADSRRGVPGYDITKETETYLLDGQMLVYKEIEKGKNANFFADINRSSVTVNNITQFSPRRQIEFQLIQRNGDKPDNYTWIVTKKDGTKYFYGSEGNQINENAILRKTAGINKGIAEWNLTKVEDVYGNYMTFKYRKESSNGNYIYPVEINYALHVSKPSTYRIKFIYKSEERSDNSIYNTRQGINRNANQLELDSIVVLRILNEEAAPIKIRKYHFEYNEGGFKKLILKKLIQYGDNDKEFNHHEFVYYNEKQDQGFFSNFVTTKIKTVNLSAGIKDPLGITSNEATAIGASKSSTNSASMYVGAGPGYDVWSVGNTAGIQYNNSSSNSSGINTLIDIDGDGLPDKVFSKDGTLQFQKNITKNDSIIFDANVIEITGAPNEFAEENSRTTGWGAKANFFGFSASYDHATTESAIKTFFSDVNGDGLIDIVSNGVVFFNTGIIKNDKELEFSSFSSKTPLPINGTGTISSSFVYDDSGNKEMIANNPLQEVVKVWEAPYDGEIMLNAPVTLLPFDHPDKNADGVWVAVESKNFNTKFHIDSTDFSSHEIDAQIHIIKGDRIFFRLQSGRADDANGANDKVRWNPQIKYVNGVHVGIDTALHKSVNDRIKFTGDKDFLLSNTAAISLPDSITDVKILGNFKKLVTMDSVQVQITAFFKNHANPSRDRAGSILKNDKGDTLFNYSFDKIISSRGFSPSDQSNSINLTLPSSFEPKEKKLQFIIKSDVNININQVSWEPTISYNKTIHLRKFTGDTTWVQVDSTLRDTIYAIPYYVFNDSLKSNPSIYDSVSTDSVINFHPVMEQSKRVDSSFWFSVKSPSEVLGKKLLTYKNGLLTDTLPLSIKILKGVPFITSFESQESEIGKTNTPAYQQIVSNITATGYYSQIQKSNAFFGTRQNSTGHVSDNLIQIKSSGNFLIIPELSVNKDSTKGNIVLQVWKNGVRVDLNSQDSILTVINGHFNYPLNYLKIASLKENDKISVLFLYENDTLNNNPNLKKSFSVAKISDAEFWVNRSNQTFGPMYKGWGQFIYNGMSKRYDRPIDENTLHLPDYNSVSENDINTFRDKVNKSVKDTTPITKQDPVIDRFSSSNIVFTPMLPFANSKIRGWIGGEDSIYLAQNAISTSRLGIDNVKSINPFKLQTTISNTSDKSYGRGIVKVSTSSSNSYTGGTFFLTGSHSNTSTTQVSDFVDVNGDRFPDVVNGANIQFTNVLGTLQSVGGNNFVHNSNSSGNGITISGRNGTKNVTAIPPNPAKPSGAATANINNAKDVDQSAGSFIGASGAYNTSDDNIDVTWLDINGDGLPDKVTKAGYQLNLGNNEFDVNRSFAGSLDIYKSTQKTLSPGITAGFSYDKKSFSGGAGLSFSDSKGESFLQDMNGDGLADIVEIDNDGNLNVQINSGKNFFSVGNWTNIAKGGTGFRILGDAASLPVRFLANTLVPGWLGMEKTKFNSSNGVSFGGSATFGFTAFVFPVKFVFNPDFNHSNSLGRTIRQIIDINADGFPDIVYSTKEGQMEVMLSTLGKTNKLAEVKNPLGGSFKINYNHVNITSDNPGGKWVMSESTIDDGIRSDRADTLGTYDSKKLFTYAGGKYDRFEREFLGFANVTTTDIDFNGKPYRDVIAQYDTNYYRAGSLLQELVQDGQDASKKYTVTRNYYDDIIISSVLATAGDSFKKEIGIKFSPLKSTLNGTYEGADSILWKNKSSYTSSREYGYLTKFTYKENPASPNDPSFNYQTLISHDADDTDPHHYIVGLPTDVLTKNADGLVISKHTGAEYYSWDEKIEGTHGIGKRKALKKIFNYLDDTRKTVTEFKYIDRDDDYGIVTQKILPNGLVYEYDYDHTASSNTHSFITKITNTTRGFSSEINYDYNYGIPTMTKDINDNVVNYKLDNFGRTISTIGPLECRNPNPATGACPAGSKLTIKIDYSLKDGNTVSNFPLTSRVNHYDEGGSGGLETINFIDGFGRSVQIKKTAELSKSDGTPDPSGKWIISGRVNYDALGRAVETYYPGIDRDINGESFIKNTGSQKYVLRTNYDVVDRKTKTILPVGHTYDSTIFSKDNQYTIATSYNINDNITSGGIQKRQIFTNGSDLTAKETLFDKADTAISTSFSYYSTHQLKEVVDSRKNKTSYKYNYSGNKTEISHPDGGITQFKYDDNGRLTHKITGVGDDIEYKYDRDRPIQILYPRHSENNVLYVYSDAREGDNNSCNRVVYQEDASGSQAFEYGRLGEITKTTRTIIAPFSSKLNTFITQFKYDTWNRIKNITYPDQETVEYKYNKAGLLSNVIGHRDKNLGLSADQQDYSYVKNIGYDEFEQRIILTYGNSTQTKYAYDSARRRLQNLSVSGIAANSSFFNSFNDSFSYDNQNNITGSVISTSKGTAKTVGVAHSYLYDRLNRLVSGSGDWNNTGEVASYKLGLDYDGVFNITNKSLTLDETKASAKAHIDYLDKYSYGNATSHQLTLLEETIHRNNDPDYTENNMENYVYDRNGNNTVKATGDKSKNENVFERKIYWDEENRINAVSMNGYVSHYVYDANGERTIKLSTENDGVYINGQFAGDTSAPATFCLYASPYFSMRNGSGIYTKHIYIGTQRIISQVENSKAFKLVQTTFPVNVDQVKCPYDIPCVESKPLAPKRDSINKRINEDFKKLDLNYELIKNNAFDNPPAYKYEKAIDPIKPDSTSKEKLPSDTKTELLNYFYHSNQVGSTSFITDNEAKVVQYVEYLPFGETFRELRQNYSSQFTFNAKEQDQETGLYYYGSRYYDSHTYQWLGVDPMTEKYPGLSSYGYCLNNPVTMRDPDGSYAVSVHYNITFDVAYSLGYSRSNADLTAHYSSTYADHPSLPVIAFDIWAHDDMSLLFKIPYRQGIDYSKTSGSQLPENSRWHSMMSDAELESGMTKEQALSRGLEFGWNMVFSSNGGKDLPRLGQGLHALQDAFAHEGASESEHLNFKNLSSYKMFLNDLYGNTEKAREITNLALKLINSTEQQQNNKNSCDQ